MNDVLLGQLRLMIGLEVNRMVASPPPIQIDKHSLARIVERVARGNLDYSDLRSAARSVAIALCQTEGGLTLEAIGHLCDPWARPCTDEASCPRVLAG